MKLRFSVHTTPATPKLTNPYDPMQAKLLSHNRANRDVAVLCNHRRADPKGFEKSMENIGAKIDAKQDAIKKAQMQLEAAKKACKSGGGNADTAAVDKKKKILEKIRCPPGVP